MDLRISSDIRIEITLRMSHLLHANRLSGPPNTICTARCCIVYHIEGLVFLQGHHLAKECNRTEDPNEGLSKLPPDIRA